MKKEIKKMLSFFLCVSTVVSCIGCGKTQGDIAGAGGNEASGSYITITDEMLQNSVVFCGNEDDWNHTPEVVDAMVNVFEGGSSNISEFLQYTCNGIDPDTIIYVGVISRPTKKPPEHILHPDPEKEKDTSYKEKLYPEVTFDEYSEKFNKKTENIRMSKTKS